MDSASIGTVSKRVGIKVPTIRFYEESQLLPAPERAANGRRLFSASDERRLVFIRRARQLGFSLEEVRSLLRLADYPEQSCESAGELVTRHQRAIDERLAHLRALKRELAALDVGCATTVRKCRIIEALAAPTVEA